MSFAESKNKFASYRSDSLLYDHIEYKNISCSEPAYQIHDLCEILFLKNGRITYTVEGRNYHVKNGSVIFTRPGQWHSLLFEDKDVYERYDITFEKGTLSEDIQKKLSSCCEVTDGENNPFIDGLFKKMDYYCKYFEGQDLHNLLRNLAEEVLYNLLLLEKVFSGDEDEIRYFANPTLIKALEYIKNNIANNFSLDDLCKELFITKSHLHRLFSKHLQTTPKKYINTKRLLGAQKALRRGEKPHKVYLNYGFGEYSTFWREYKKHFGYSPSEEGKQTIIRKIEY